MKKALIYLSLTAFATTLLPFAADAQRNRSSRSNARSSILKISGSANSVTQDQLDYINNATANGDANTILKITDGGSGTVTPPVTPPPGGGSDITVIICNMYNKLQEINNQISIIINNSNNGIDCGAETAILQDEISDLEYELSNWTNKLNKINSDITFYEREIDDLRGEKSDWESKKSKYTTLAVVGGVGTAVTGTIVGINLSKRSKLKKKEAELKSKGASLYGDSLGGNNYGQIIYINGTPVKINGDSVKIGNERYSISGDSLRASNGSTYKLETVTDSNGNLVLSAKNVKIDTKTMKALTKQAEVEAEMLGAQIETSNARNALYKTQSNTFRSGYNASKQKGAFQYQDGANTTSFGEGVNDGFKKSFVDGITSGN